MAIAMAPGLSQINVFETPNTGNVQFANDILTSMATTLPLSNQLSSSWFFGVNSNTQPILYELAIQGQSFFQAAGDQGSSSWATDPGDVRDLDAVTVVGGTTLTLTGPPQAYGSEVPWNLAAQGAGGGEIAANATLPSYQSGRRHEQETQARGRAAICQTYPRSRQIFPYRSLIRPRAFRRQMAAPSVRAPPLRCGRLSSPSPTSRLNQSNRHWHGRERQRIPLLAR